MCRTASHDFFPVSYWVPVELAVMLLISSGVMTFYDSLSVSEIFLEVC